MTGCAADPFLACTPIKAYLGQFLLRNMTLQGSTFDWPEKRRIFFFGLKSRGGDLGLKKDKFNRPSRSVMF